MRRAIPESFGNRMLFPAAFDLAFGGSASGSVAGISRFSVAGAGRDGSRRDSMRAYIIVLSSLTQEKDLAAATGELFKYLRVGIPQYRLSRPIAPS